MCRITPVLETIKNASQRLKKADHPNKNSGANRLRFTLFGLPRTLLKRWHPIGDSCCAADSARRARPDVHASGTHHLVIQVTSSLLQPLVGLTTDKHPTKYMLAIGMCSTLVGLVALSQASVFASMLLAVAFLGFGSAVFHPEATRIAQLRPAVAKDWLNRSFRSEETPAWLWGRSRPLSL